MKKSKSYYFYLYGKRESYTGIFVITFLQMLKIINKIVMLKYYNTCSRVHFYQVFNCMPVRYTGEILNFLIKLDNNYG